MSVISLEELSKITGYGTVCLRSYLQGYRFTRFERHAKVKNYVQTVYLFNEDFVQEFTKFIWLKKRADVSGKLQKKLLSLAEQEK
jgi:hypothetical protein